MAGFQSIQRRLALIVSLGSLAIAALVGLLAFSMEYRAQYRLARQLQDQLVGTVQASAAVAAFARNDDIATEVAEGLLINPIIASVEIVSLSGFHHGRSRLVGGEGELVSYPLLSPIDRVERIGDLLVRQDAEEIGHRALNAALAYAGLMTFQIAISGMLLMLLFGRVVGRPLTRAAYLLERTPAGSSQRIPVPNGHENNEIGMLVNSCNVLLDAVEKAILQERSMRAEVDEIQARYRRIFETTNVGIMILSPDGALINCNATLMSRIVGVAFDTPPIAGYPDFIGTIFTVPEKAWMMVQEALDLRRAVAADLKLRSSDGGERWVHCMMSVEVDEVGAIRMIEGVLYDVTARHRRESEARQAAKIDPLTGLANRRGVEAFLDRAIRRADSSGDARLGVLMIDLDGFKEVNDTHGHAAGDRVLKVIGQRIAKRLRRSLDLVARLGGDEFTVVVSDTDQYPGLLELIATDLLQLISQPIELNDAICVGVGASIGVASFPDDGQTRKSLLDAADAAMYSAKRQGKSCFALAGRLSESPSPEAAAGGHGEMGVTQRK